MSICMFVSRWLWSKLYLTTVPSTVVMEARHLVRAFLEHCHRTRNPTSLALVNRDPPAISIIVPRFVQISTTEIYNSIKFLKRPYHVVYCKQWLRQVAYLHIFFYSTTGRKHIQKMCHHQKRFQSSMTKNFMTDNNEKCLQDNQIK